MDTTSNALSRILHLLALNPDVQTKLRAEIVEAQGGDHSDLPYDDLVKLPYLDAVCRETLRVYAPVTLSGRTYVNRGSTALHAGDVDPTSAGRQKTRSSRSHSLYAGATAKKSRSSQSRAAPWP